MALPKEPRQKMINFMYLVLTAMLALNVSTEILNAFKVVDKSLMNSSITIDKSSATSLSAIEEAKKDAGMKEKAEIWKPKADSAMMLTNQLSKYIDDLKTSLKTESGLVMKDGKEDFKEDDLDAATRLMDTKGEGKKLFTQLEQFKTALVNIIPEKYRSTIPQLPIDLTPPQSNNEASKDLTTAYFHMTPTVAALTMLSKFQNDVKRSGNIVVDYCQQQLGKVILVFDKFVPFTSQNSQYLLPGQPFEIQAGLGAFSSQVKPTVSINGASQAVNDSGYASYRESAGGGGTKTFNIVVTFKDPNTGEMKTANKTVSYTVGQSSGAAVFLEKMNVIYLGVDNPLRISGGSGKRESMQVSFAGGSIKNVGGDEWIARAENTGKFNINVTLEGKTTSFEMRCKLLPNPVALAGASKGGPISTSLLKATGGIRAQLEDSEFEAPFTVLGYTIGGYVNGQYTEQAVSSAQWGSNPIMSNAKPGNLVSFFNIRAQGPDGKPRKLNDLTFKLQ